MKDCAFKESCICDGIKDNICEFCSFYQVIDSGYGYCKSLPKPVIIPWCKDICSLYRRESYGKKED